MNLIPTPTDRLRRFAALPVHDGAPPLIRVYQLPQPAIQLLTALVEASDGIGLVRTLDEDRGIIECWIMPDFIEEYEAILRAVAQAWPLQPLGREFE
jgi:hypothetical protein